MKTRRPIVAGRFYEGEKHSLKKQIKDVYLKEKGSIDLSYSEKEIIGGIVPHAGYMFSAYEAVHYFKILSELREKPETFIIINPNHRGYEPSIALDENDFWETPFGTVEIDSDFYNELDFEKSSTAHEFEHSGEVMVPLLQYFLSTKFKIVPITLSKQTPEVAELLANSIFAANKKLNKKINIITSSDFSHYVSPEKGKENDDLAVYEILNKNPGNLYQVIQKNNISICGYGPIMTLMYYAKLLSGNIGVDILRRGHSGDIVPSNEVVHYITFLFYNKNTTGQE